MSGAPERIGAVGHYNLLERLEPAGPGDLYRARDTRLGRTVTLRLLPDGFAGSAAARAALVAQARDLLSLSHPNLVTLFDVGEDGGRVYFAFEYLRGQPLRGEMAGRPMNVRRAVELGIQIADALADAQGAGFAHGGLSPDSVVVTAKGKIKVPAFGMAAQTGFEPGDDVRLRDYAAPEEAQGRRPDDRSDIYSVGAILYEMLTARRPHPRGAAAPSDANAHVPAELDRLVLRAVAPDPGARFETAAALSAALRAVQSVLDVRDVADDGDEEMEADAGRGARPGLALALALVLGALAAAVWLLS
jgi:serine/threonine protein kinase